ncbi:MAG TPA: hypothetical protein VFB06_06400 [Streptosporangiaceae bacterium]|nr:hypothetical protein [Streptosporangiaceae bacterium]
MSTGLCERIMLGTRLPGRWAAGHGLRDRGLRADLRITRRRITA